MIATAKLKYLGVSAQKTRLVVDQVRGKPVGEALASCATRASCVAKDLEKLVQSAVANAQQKDPKLDVDRLVVAKRDGGRGPAAEARPRTARMGRVFRILKRACT